MNTLLQFLIAAVILCDVLMAVSPRLFTLIKTVGLAGFLIGLLPLASHAELTAGLVAVSAVNALVKGALIPFSLAYAMRRTAVKREIEPYVGYSASALIVCAVTAAGFLLGARLHVPAGAPAALAVPAAVATVGTGLFLIISRKKAITQVIGFLTLENGIALFGTGVAAEYGFFIELGMLLDVLVLVFILGIAVFRINKTFAHIDANELHALKD